ncbi:MAG TPA: SDR family oxidoreductase [Phycisphaerales bacterium]|nr:SDR family oxidoreductase [Phycisphaerales bacterium]
MDISLHGLRALVCGSTSGIGKASAIELAALGADVTLAARSADKLALALHELPRTGTQHHATLVVDTADAGSVQRACAEISASSSTFHILVNNTGGPPGGTMFDATQEQLLAAFQSLMLSAHALTRAVVPGMKAAGYGRIINIQSTSVKQPIPGLGLSNAVRAAVANWAKSLSMELAPFGITVNNVLPGYTDTDRLAQLLGGRAAKAGSTLGKVTGDVISTIPAGRLGKAQEIAAAVAFLASPAAAYINGINLPVDGARLGTL